MARDGFLPATLAQVSTRTATPVAASVATGGTAALIAFVLPMSVLAHLTSIGAAFADVDPKKVGTDYQFFEHRVPVVHFAAAAPPFVLCVALDRTAGAFEANLASLKLTEGVDYFHFC